MYSTKNRNLFYRKVKILREGDKKRGKISVKVKIY
jgi:hypothetical protein